MNDFDHAAWADHHARWSDWLTRALRHTARCFSRLQARRFDAPWRATQNHFNSPPCP